MSTTRELGVRWRCSRGPLPVAGSHRRPVASPSAARSRAEILPSPIRHSSPKARNVEVLGGTLALTGQSFDIAWNAHLGGLRSFPADDVHATNQRIYLRHFLRLRHRLSLPTAWSHANESKHLFPLLPFTPSREACRLDAILNCPPSPPPTISPPISATSPPHLYLPHPRP